MMKLSIKRFTLSLLIASMLVSGLISATKPKNSPDYATLSFSNAKSSITNIKQINKILHSVGVNLSQVIIPHKARSILDLSSKIALNSEQQAKIITIFSLDRKELLNQIYQANRKPVIADGGSISTQEEGVPVYPKIFDMQSMSPQNRIDALNKFGKLHVNYANNGDGVDEVMTLVSGGPWTWFFMLKDQTVVKLALSRVSPKGLGWRISYPGLTPHGAFMDAKDGICVAYIHGPKIWHMYYDAPHINGANLLGTNPWVNFMSKKPILLDKTI